MRNFIKVLLLATAIVSAQAWGRYVSSFSEDAALASYLGIGESVTFVARRGFGTSTKVVYTKTRDGFQKDDYVFEEGGWKSRGTASVSSVTVPETGTSSIVTYDKVTRDSLQRRVAATHASGDRLGTFVAKGTLFENISVDVYPDLSVYRGIRRGIDNELDYTYFGKARWDGSEWVVDEAHGLSWSPYPLRDGNNGNEIKTKAAVNAALDPHNIDKVKAAWTNRGRWEQEPVSAPALVPKLSPDDTRTGAGTVKYGNEEIPIWNGQGTSKEGAVLVKQNADLTTYTVSVDGVPAPTAEYTPTPSRYVVDPQKPDSLIFVGEGVGNVSSSSGDRTYAVMPSGAVMDGATNISQAIPGATRYGDTPAVVANSTSLDFLVNAERPMVTRDGAFGTNGDGRVFNASGAVVWSRDSQANVDTAVTQLKDAAHREGYTNKDAKIFDGKSLNDLINSSNFSSEADQIGAISAAVQGIEAIAHPEGDARSGTPTGLRTDLDKISGKIDALKGKGVNVSDYETARDQISASINNAVATDGAVADKGKTSNRIDALEGAVDAANMVVSTGENGIGTRIDALRGMNVNTEAFEKRQQDLLDGFAKSASNGTFAIQPAEQKLNSLRNDVSKALEKENQAKTEYHEKQQHYNALAEAIQKAGLTNPKADTFNAPSTDTPRDGKSYTESLAIVNNELKALQKNAPFAEDLLKFMNPGEAGSSSAQYVTNKNDRTLTGKFAGSEVVAQKIGADSAEAFIVDEKNSGKVVSAVADNGGDSTAQQKVIGVYTKDGEDFSFTGNNGDTYVVGDDNIGALRTLNRLGVTNSDDSGNVLGTVTDVFSSKDTPALKIARLDEAAVKNLEDTFGLAIKNGETVDSPTADKNPQSVANATHDFLGAYAEIRKLKTQYGDMNRINQSIADLDGKIRALMAKGSLDDNDKRRLDAFQKQKADLEDGKKKMVAAAVREQVAGNELVRNAINRANQYFFNNSKLGSDAIGGGLYNAVISGANLGTTKAEAIKNMDIGGPGYKKMLASAVANVNQTAERMGVQDLGLNAGNSVDETRVALEMALKNSNLTPEQKNALDGILNDFQSQNTQAIAQLNNLDDKEVAALNDIARQARVGGLMEAEAANNGAPEPGANATEVKPQGIGADLWDIARTALIIAIPLAAETEFKIQQDMNVAANSGVEAVGPVDGTVLAEDTGEDATSATTVTAGAALVAQLLQNATVDMGLLSEEVNFATEPEGEEPVYGKKVGKLDDQQEGYRTPKKTSEGGAEEEEEDDAEREMIRKEIERRRAELLKQYVNAGIQISEGMNAISHTFFERAKVLSDYASGVQTEAQAFVLAQDVGRYVLFETLRGLALSSVQMGVQASRLLFEQEVDGVRTSATVGQEGGN